MRFDLFHTRVDAHIRKAQEYLQQANIARLEHQIAADHHSALASMYAQRVAWLEQELSDSVSRFGPSLRGIVSTPADGAKRGPESIMTLSRTQRAGAIDGA
ncbi:hypothetical protein [Polaromonas sp. UC242_47]|uniref:hypothetical protein n=1 Tax=Polaromonas sp. UC242_47 TaxID=3374626 RepID=UPI0037A2B723